MIYIDGIEYDVRCDITRVSEMRSTEISGEMMDGSYFNDVSGTWLQYDIALSFPLYSQARYGSLYERLSAPVSGHDFVLPYNDGLIALNGRVEGLTDDHDEQPGGRAYWKKLRFSVIANHASKFNTLEGVLIRGRPSLPEVSADVGDAYMFTESGWEPIESAEDRYY